MKYEAVAIDLRQIADELYEKKTLMLEIPFPMYLTWEDTQFIENHIKIRTYKEYLEKQNAENKP